MSEPRREAWITGIGILSCLGEGPDAHWRALMEAQPTADTTHFTPYVVHPLAPVDFDKQIPKKGDQRQMEPWQRIGTYAAGLALESAGLKGKAELLSRMDMIVAAGGGERDLAAEGAIMTGLAGAADREAFLNERMMSDLRPTLFLAQLSNLLAGNISIVHGVTGSSRTFMGEEAAGVDTVRIGVARVAAGQSDLMLVGGAHNAERKDMLLVYEAGGYLLKERFAPVWERGALGGGMALGSLGAFLVLESPQGASARGVAPLARITAVLSERADQARGAGTAALERMWTSLAPRLAPERCAIISGASGAEPATAEERVFLAAHPEFAVRATATHLGHAPEAQFPMNIALAALALRHASLFPPGGETAVERPMAGPLAQVLVTGIGHWRGAGMALVEAG